MSPHELETPFEKPFPDETNGGGGSVGCTCPESIKKGVAKVRNMTGHVSSCPMYDKWYRDNGQASSTGTYTGVDPILREINATHETSTYEIAMYVKNYLQAGGVIDWSLWSRLEERTKAAFILANEVVEKERLSAILHEPLDLE